ncbi:MAG: hypothetical protein E4H27_01790 [Anaerolineales bacterium]|nr:MAG: hypothetical protein E4H27_01790 [Anaerolineales bacterium]
MLANEESIGEEIRRLEFDTTSARKWASEGKIEAWVHKYLLAGKWANPEFSKGLKQTRRWWKGPIEVNLVDLFPVVGTEPGMEYVVDKDAWYVRANHMAQSLTDPEALPPLIVEYRAGKLSIRDGNTRYEAMKLLGWQKCWVIIWYNSESEYHQHNIILF